MRIEFTSGGEVVALFAGDDESHTIEGARRQELSRVVERGIVTNGPLIVRSSDVGVASLVLHFAESARYSSSWFDSYSHDLGDVELWVSESEGFDLI